KHGDIDVLLLDLNMPRLNGIDLLDRIDPPPPVVLVVSAFETQREADLEKRLGTKVFGYLRKPMKPPQLLQAVAQAADRSRRSEGAGREPDDPTSV
ncbi:MAG: response regulator, partial [Acidimicrobiales bacterium]